jgi:tetratricopeptide (TPR) repeat protein
MTANNDSSKERQNVNTSTKDVESENRASPLSILDLSAGDSEENNGGSDSGTDRIEIVAEMSTRQEERKYCDVSILPTIQEITASEEERGETDNEFQQDDVSNIVDDLSSLVRMPLASPRAGNDSSKQEARQLIEKASKLASQGKEEKAMETYKRALYNLKSGVKAVSSQMEMAANRPKLEKTALYIVLHEEWTEFAKIIAEVRCAMATLYERHGHYDKSIRNFEEALNIFRHQADFDERHYRKASNAYQKEKALDGKIKQLDEAKGSQLARQALHETIDRIREKINATTDETSLRFLQEDLHEQISIVLSLETVHLGESHPRVADTKELLGTLYFERGQVKKSLQLMHNSVEIMEKALGLIHPRTGLKYKQAGKMYEKLGGSNNRVIAIEFYEKAIKALKSSAGNFSKELCTLLNDIGVLYMRQEQYGPAIKSLDEANRCWNKSYKDGDEGDSSVISIRIWLNLAECYGQSGEKDLAVTAIRKALNLQKYLQSCFDDDKTGKKKECQPTLIAPQGIATTLKCLGKALASQGKYSQAYEPLLEAIAILQGEYDTAQVAAATDPTVDLPQCQDEVASALYAIAEVKQADGKHDEAKKLFQESLQLRRSSDKLRPINQKKNHVHCAMCLAGIGSIGLLKGDSSGAYKLFNAAIHIIKKEELPDSHPIVSMLWHKSHIASRKMLEDCAIDTKAEF